MTRVVVGEFDDQAALVFGQRGCDLLHQLLLSVNVDGCEQFILVNGLKQVFVSALALFFGIGKGGDVPKVAFLLQLLRTAGGKFEEFF